MKTSYQFRALMQMTVVGHVFTIFTQNGYLQVRNGTIH